MNSVVLQAVYNGERIQVLDTDKLTDYKRRCTKGLMLAMSIEPWKEARTRRQQGLLHELLGRHARQENVQMQWLKDRIKYDLGYWIPLHKIESGNVDPPAWRGKLVDVHAIYPSVRVHSELSIILLRSEADYTTSMEKDFIDRVIYECQESGTDIDDIMRTLHELNQEGT